MQIVHITEKFATALKELHAECGQDLDLKDILKAIVVKKGDKIYEHEYAPLEHLTKKVNPVLAKHGFTMPCIYDDKDIVTLLLHESGGYMSSRYPVVAAVTDSTQWTTAKVTQIRRSQIMCLLGIDDGSSPDTDGNVDDGNTITGKDRNEVDIKKGEKVVDGIEKKLKVQEEIEKVVKKGRPIKKKEASDKTTINKGGDK